MKLKPGYKQTELGVLPEDWAVKPLKCISPRQSVGLVINPSTYFDKAGTVPMLVGSNVSENSIDSTTANRITSSNNKVLSASRLAAGDLVTVRVGEPGVTAVVPPELNGCNCASIMVIRQHPSFDSYWLSYAMNSRRGRQQVEHVQYGTAQKQFNISDAVDFCYPVPPLPEQRAIAQALGDVDALVGVLDRLIAKKRDLKQAVMQQLLTGQTRLPGFHGEWNEKPFGEITSPRKERIDPRRGGVKDFCVELEHIESGTGNLLGETATRSNSSLKSVFDKGDVLFGKLRAYLRKYWLADRPGVCSTEVWVFKPNLQLITSSYLFQLVKDDHFVEAASSAYGTHMPRSDWNVVKNYVLRLPLLPEQTAIADVLTAMDAELEAFTARLAKTREVKQAMMQELLTGRTRLVSVEVPHA
ncbi:MAG TPA: restriction endonuclease subunit S [Bryobacteraceae bacterium]|nr:restriction endonuclease subunit S [Candidatus Limnocylindrales bacterium]HXJ38700.1 restriction endonuclease subunit S [Bryobacteraceae bacterium]